MKPERPALHREVKVAKLTYDLTLPRCSGGAKEAFLEDPLLDGIAPMSICLYQAGDACDIKYRWLAGSVWVTLIAGGYSVTMRHSHRRRFVLADHPDRSDAHLTTDATAEVEVQPYKFTARRPVWRQQRDELGNAIGRLDELHNQVEDWLQAAQGHV